MSKSTHRADASALLDNRGYTGPLIRGQNPALLLEKPARDRITESYYFKEQCFGLNAATLCDRAVEVGCVGGTYGLSGRPTPFLCLVFKMLQLVPEREIVLEYLRMRGEGVGSEEEGEGSEEEEERYLGGGGFKYLRALAAFYIRLTWEPVDIYKTLEPLLSDYRKLKRRTKDGFTLTYMDQFVDDLLTKDRVCGTSLWKMPSRTQLEDLDLLEPRISPLGEEVDEIDADDESVNGRRESSEDRYRSDSERGSERNGHRSDSEDDYRRRRRSRSEDSEDGAIID